MAGSLIIIQRNIGMDKENRSEAVAREPGVDFTRFFAFRIWRKKPPNPQPKSATEIAINAK